MLGSPRRSSASASRTPPASNVRAYSLGMKQRLGIAGALLTDRDLLVLDEPTNGLDPQGTREVRSLIRSLADEGTTVFVSSHLLAEIEQICTHAAIMRTGRLVAQGSLDELRGAGGPRRAPRDAGCARSPLDVLARLGLPGREAGRTEACRGGAARRRASGVRADASRRSSAAGVRVRGFAVHASSLEERFVALTGEGFDVEQ